MKVSAKSPKNKFMASITYSKALAEIGSVSTALGMTIEYVKINSLFYTNQATRNKASSLVVVYENKKEYPFFDWVEVDRFTVNENRGGDRANAGRKPKYSEETKTIAFRVPKSKENEVKKVINDLLETYKI